MPPFSPLPKLGRKAPRHDDRTLQLAHYLLPDLPAPPPVVDWTTKIPGAAYGMMGNDALGDCTCAAAGHMIQTWTSQTTGLVTVPDAAIVAAYRAVSGYDPAKPRTDQGAVALDVLKHWRKHGVGGHKLGAFAALEPRNVDHVRDAVHLFGGAYVGLNLPRTAQRQRVWSLPSQGWSNAGRPGSWGGHAVCVVGYDRHGLTCVTWGALQRMTWSFWRTYSDEAFACLAPEWLAPSGKAPSGVDAAALRADLQLVAG